jgi:hypothetical protein
VINAAGLRADLTEADPNQHYLLVGANRSTGLTSGVAIADTSATNSTRQDWH